MADLPALAARSLRELRTLVDAVPASQYGEPTPCSEWTVLDLLGHIVAVNRKYERIGRLGEEWIPGAHETDLGDDPAAAYRETVEPFVEAWSAPEALTRAVDSPEGPMPGEIPLRAHLRETLVHGWDLAAATGRVPPFDDEAALICLALFGEERPAAAGYADQVLVGEELPPIVRLAALFGRDVTAWPG